MGAWSSNLQITRKPEHEIILRLSQVFGSCCTSSRNSQMALTRLRSNFSMMKVRFSRLHTRTPRVERERRCVFRDRSHESQLREPITLRIWCAFYRACRRSRRRSFSLCYTRPAPVREARPSPFAGMGVVVALGCSH